MIDPTNVPNVEPSEKLARYVVQRSHIRPSDQTVKPDLFVPHPHDELSVTRHFMATEAELWSIGHGIASRRGLSLYGRGDIGASVCVDQHLLIIKDPIEGNPNHTLIKEWPADKAAQKMIAQEIAARAEFVAVPATGR